MIKPSWNKKEFPDKIVIKIDPKMAFGTGHHETTQLCIQELIEKVKLGDKVLDVGTGSGILAIVAAKLGASYILGLDIDEIAIENTKENVLNNDVEDKIIDLKVGPVDKNTPKNYFDLVVANLFKKEIFESFDQIKKTVKKDGRIILSGILESEKKETLRFLKEKKVKTIRITQVGDWLCLVVK